jgi:hypothetical protein
MARKIFRAVARGAGLTIKGVFRVIALLLLFLVLLSATAYVTVRKMFGGDEAKSMISSAFQEALHRPVQIEGVVVTPQGVKLKGVKVFEQAGVQRGPWLTSESAIVTINPLALAEWRLELGTVRLLNPEITFYRDEAGSWNVSDLFVSTRAAEVPATHAPGGLPFSIAAGKTVIEGGRLTVDDRLRSRLFTIDKFSLQVKDFSLTQAFPVALSFDNVNHFGDTAMTASWSASGTAFLAGFDWPNAEFKAQKLQVVVDGVPVKGTVWMLGFPKGEITADLKVPAVSGSVLSRYVKKELPASIPATHWQATLTLPEPRQIEVRALSVQSAPLSFKASGLVDFSSAPKISGTITVPDTSLAEAAALAPKLARFGLRGRAQGKGTFAADQEKLEFTDVTVSARGFESKSQDGHKLSNADFVFHASDDFTKATLSLSRGSALLFDEQFDGLGVSAALVNNELKIDKLGLSWHGSPATFKARVKPAADPKSVLLAGDVEHIRWEDAQRLIETITARLKKKAEEKKETKKKWLHSFKYTIPKTFPDTVGKVTVRKITQANFDCGNLDLLWDIRGISPTLKQLSGEVKVGFGPGRVNDIPTVQKSHNILRIIFLPFVFMHKMNNLSVLATRTAYPKTLDFNRIEGEYGLKQGVATTRYFFVDSPQLMVFADGIADFGKEAVDMRILTRLTGERGGLPEWWVDEAGRPAIGFRVKNDINDPELEPRLNKMKATEIEENKEAGMARARLEFTGTDKLKLLEK